MRISADERRAAIWGAIAMLALAVLIVAGSRNLNHLDAALVGYTFATLFATFGITYRYTMWLSRPPRGYSSRASEVPGRRPNPGASTCGSAPAAPLRR